MRMTDLYDRMSPYGVVPEVHISFPFFIFKRDPFSHQGFENKYGKLGTILLMDLCASVLFEPIVAHLQDGELSTVLKTYREILHGASDTFFDLAWPRVKLLMAHAMKDYDTEGDGVIRGPQFNTYDCVITGANTFIGTIYLCALRAAEEMAILKQEFDLAQDYHQRFLLGSKNLDRICWKEEYGYYVNPGYDPNSNNAIGDGCHTDQLLGQWWAHLLNLGYLLPPDHIQTAMKQWYNNNRQVGFDPNTEAPRKYCDQRDAAFWFVFPLFWNFGIIRI
jgi:hypothetical protein